MASTRAYPRKLFYKINEVAEIIGVEAYVLRYWETKFSMLKPERIGNDERRYRSHDIDLLLRIRSLLYDEKFTIAGAFERIKRDPKGLQEVKASTGKGSSATIVQVSAPQIDEDEEQQMNLFVEEGAPTLTSIKSALASIRAELVGMKAEL